MNAMLDNLLNQYQSLPSGVRSLIDGTLKHLPIHKILKKLPYTKNVLEQETSKILSDLEESFRPYNEEHPNHQTLPKKGLRKDTILSEMQDLADQETNRWQKGYVSGAVYHGDPKHIDFLNDVYALSSQTNPLHPDLWPSIAKYESEVIAMAANMLGASKAKDKPQVVGSVTLGGTDSILLAMKAYRDQAGLKNPEIIACETAHAAFDKAAQYFNIKLIKIPMDINFQISIKQVEKAINRNTICIIGSAPGYPHGIIDPIDKLNQLTLKYKVGLHVDACLGGFILPFIKKKNPFDFSLQGVTSMSVDTHKYGYSAKGSSIILYRKKELRHFQYFTTTTWPGGIYFSPTFLGSRPGALIAQARASMLHLGQSGYEKASQKIISTAEVIKDGIKKIAGLRVLGDPLWVIAFTSDEYNIYEIMDHMTEKGWNLNGLHKPACIHICVTLRHTQPRVAQRFLKDLKDSVEKTKSSEPAEQGMAPIYGMAATIPVDGLVDELLKGYMDLMTKP